MKQIYSSLLCLIFAINSNATSIQQETLINADLNDNSWLTTGKNYQENRFSHLDQINVNNANRLQLVRKTVLPEWRGIEATPLLIDNVFYLTGPWSIAYAISAINGEILWTYDPKVPKQAAINGCCDVVNRGLAAWGNLLYLGTFDGRLVAINRQTGQKVWETTTVDQSKPYTITGAPRVVNGKVFIGNGGAEFGVRGYFSAYDASSGKMLWRFYTVPGDPKAGFENEAMAKAAETWTGEWWKYGGGGTVWDSMAYDPQLDLLYVGTGNGSPWDRKHRSPQGGDNLYLSSILAIKPDTGELIWHYQTTPGDSWDFTATQHLILADLKMNGKIRQVIMQAPKNGFFYVLDRKNGELLRADPFTYVNWATHVDIESGRPIENDFARYENVNADIAPNYDGGHNWHPMAFNPNLGLVFIPGRNTVSNYGRDLSWAYNKTGFGTGAGWNLATGEQADKPYLHDIKAPRNGFLKAWDPVSKRAVWEIKQAEFWNGGLLTTGGNLVFQGTSDGYFDVYDATNGTLLQHIEVGIGILAPPITYMLNGRQYVTVAAGWGGGYGMKNIHTDKLKSGALLTFAVTTQDEALQILHPENEREYSRLSPHNAPIKTNLNWQLKPNIYYQGETLFNSYCAVCHVINESRGGIAPNLRSSAMITEPILAEIVLKGGLQERGMPTFIAKLSPAEVKALSHFLLSQQNQIKPQ